jgi:nitrate reductase (NAD(P)H)
MGQGDRVQSSTAAWEEVAGVDQRDVGTADSWVQRDKELIRHTGLHPLNAELPIDKIAGEFVTPAEKGYVRCVATNVHL